jgi:hypothetical protein
MSCAVYWIIVIKTMIIIAGIVWGIKTDSKNLKQYSIVKVSPIDPTDKKVLHKVRTRNQLERQETQE